MAGTVIPAIPPQFFTDNGVPAAGYKLFTYDAGTTTKRSTYSDVDLTTPNTNPIVLDSAGRATIFLSPTSYKFVLAPPTDTDPPNSPIWTRDNVAAIGAFNTNQDVIAVAGESLVTNDVVYLSDGSGGNTAGRWYKTDADLTYASSAAGQVGMAVAAISTGATGSVRLMGRITGLSSLTPGAQYYVSATAGALTSTAPTNAREVGVADSSSAIVLNVGPVEMTATHHGLVRTPNLVQLQTYIGAATSSPASLGGLIYSDVTVHTLPQNSTNVDITTFTLPANLLNANGKCLRIYLGSSTAMTGANTKTLNFFFNNALVLGLYSSVTNIFPDFRLIVIRTGTTTADLMSYNAGSPGPEVGFNSTAMTGLDFTAGMIIKTQGSTGATSTLTQTYFLIEALG